LFVADATPSGLAEVTRDLTFTRLGEGVDATGQLQPAALTRTYAAVGHYAAEIAKLGVDKVRFVATSAARDATNREEFFAGVRERLGVTPEIITGAEEAELSFLGALTGGPVWGSVLVMDIGGGSTELIRGSAAGRVEAAESLDMGSVRVRERFLHHDPPLDSETTAARAFIDGLLAGSPVAFDGVGTWVGVAGTTTSLSGMYLGLETYDRAKVHNSVLPVADIEALSERLLRLTVAETCHAYPSLPPQRAEVIVAGALICTAVARRVNRLMIVRETDILDGAAHRLVET
jgi:exopolyphosphatase/guanosine-5'-triphosphate,3'-diphosphate pyrophosphatase